MPPPPPPQDMSNEGRARLSPPELLSVPNWKGPLPRLFFGELGLVAVTLSYTLTHPVCVRQEGTMSPGPQCQLPTLQASLASYQKCFSARLTGQDPGLPVLPDHV